MAFDLANLRADTSSIIEDWGETVAFERATSAIVTNAGGHTTQTWSTNLTTQVDFQTKAPLPIEIEFRGRAGVKYQPEGVVFLRHGSDVAAGDRFDLGGVKYYIEHTQPDEDKMIAYVSRKEE